MKNFRKTTFARKEWAHDLDRPPKWELIEDRVDAHYNTQFDPYGPEPYHKVIVFMQEPREFQNTKRISVI